MFSAQGMVSSESVQEMEVMLIWMSQSNRSLFISETAKVGDVIKMLIPL